MWGKKAKSANVANAPVEAESKKQTKEEVKSRIAEYQESIETCEESIKTELKALKIAAGNLKLTAKSVSKVKGIFKEKARKKKKYAQKLSAYDESLEEYIRINSHINWLLNTVSSCYEAKARLKDQLKEYRAARKIRVKAQKYLAKVNYNKSKLEKSVDGIVMPVTSYVR